MTRVQHSTTCGHCSRPRETIEARGLWLEFDQEPWEANDSGYYGATLAAIAVGIAPGNYAITPEIQENLKRLCEYLIRERRSTVHNQSMFSFSGLPQNFRDF